MKLGLGTVQFGLDYGVTNAAGQTPLSEVQAMLSSAQTHGVEVLDTAALYGEAESVLGKTLPRPHAFRIVSKTLPLDPKLAPTDALAALRSGVDQSLEKLGEAKLAALLGHRPDDLLGPQGDALYRTLSDLRDAGIVEKIGVSVYTAEEIHTLLNRYPLDLVQLPLNVLDQRILERDGIDALHESGCEIHVRSAFLQGLLLAPPDDVPERLIALLPALHAWQAVIAALDLTPLTAALGYLKGITGLSTVVCGAASLKQWEEIQNAFAAAPALPPATFKKLSVADDKLIDPRYWPKG